MTEQPQHAAEAHADYEDAAFTSSASVFWSLRVGEALQAFIFLVSLPFWKPLTWFVLVAGSGVWLNWYANRPAIKQLPTQERRWHYRWGIWLRMGFGGTAVYFLYVTGDVTMQLLLSTSLLCSAVLLTLRMAGDYVRVLVAVALLLLPTSIRNIYEGITGNILSLLIGLGGFVVTTIIVFMSRVQERVLIAQFEMRKRAELATDAVASLGLAKSRFFAAVSHDLRQPVHAIGLYLDPLIALANRSQNEAAMRATEGIRQSWRALDGLLSQVLDLTRMDSGALQADVQSIELAPLVRGLVMQQSAAAERAGIRIVALVPEARFAAADDLMLKRVLSNLIDNAIKFSPTGRPIVVALRSAGADWHIQVRDGGIGIAPDAQDKIFEEFVQLNNEARDRKRGLGLGLAISKRFAMLMGGDISVRSKLGCGCCMTLRLRKAPNEWQTFQPHQSQSFLVHSPTGVPTPSSFGTLQSVQHNETPYLPEQDILLVEDDNLVSDAMCQLLQSWGQTVLQVATAEAAHAKSSFGSIAICDVRLPDGASGIEVALMLRAKGKKVILISGETDAQVRSAALTHGLDLMIKPVSSSRLLRTLQALK
jgi:two-component system, sensor histidine kinase